MTHRVSIIIANYNYGRFLGEAIESAQRQTFPHIEIIVIDDGSTDNSLEVACRYDITVLAQENQGVCAARNNAAAYAKGEYILFLDADDILMPDAVAQLHALLANSPDDIGYAYGQMEYFDSRTGIFASREFDARALADNNYICATSLIRKEIFDRIGGFDRGFSLREDWEFYLRMLHNGFRGAFIPRPILRYRKHKEPTRKNSKTPKRIAATRLEYLYPRLFIRKILSHPLRHLYYRWRFRIGPDVRHYGPTNRPPCRISQSSVA